MGVGDLSRIAINIAQGSLTVERAIRALAELQGGHVSRQQLLALGVTSARIGRWVKRGLLIPVYNGVYAVGHLPSSPIDRARGALLACGERSAISHGWAAAYWGAFKHYPDVIELSTPLDRRVRGLRVHRVSTLARSDVRTVDRGLRVTTPARAVLDVSPRLTDRRLTRVINDLRLAHRLELLELQQLAERLPRHPGARRVAPILAIGQREPTRSELEDAFERFAREIDLPPYELNVHICGHRVDFYLPPPIDLIIELDGWSAHQTRQQFVANRRQDADILAQTGIPTVRLVYDDIALERFAPVTAERLLAVIARRRGQAPNR
jgi:very-short-patch-repair endonuclease